MASELQQWAYGLRDQYINKVESALGLGDPGRVTITVVPVFTDKNGNPDPNIAGETQGSNIQISAAYFKAHPQDKGAVIHEIAHAVLSSNFSGPTWLSEGLADYARDKVGLGSSAGADDNAKGGYQESAAFLQWLEKSQPGSVKAIAQYAASGQPVDQSLFHNAIASYKAGTTPEQMRDLINQSSEPIIPYAPPGARGHQNDYLHPNQDAGSHGGGTSTGGTQKPTTPPPPGYHYVQGKDGTWSLEADGGGNDDKARKIANAKASFHSLLQSYGIPLDSEMQALVQNAVANGWNSDRFLNHLYQTDAFQQEFPGIFAKDGTLKMSVSDYLATKQSFQSTASSAGIDIGQNKISYLFNHNVSAQEFQDRATSFQRLRDNPQLLKALNQQRAIDGLPELSEQELFKGIMGEGNKEFYQGWQSAVTRYQAEQAGLKIGEVGRPGQYGHISEKMLNRINSKGLSEDQLNADFQSLAQDFLTIIPESEIQNHGISKHMIERAVFGGPNQAALKLKMQKILDTKKALDDNTLAASSSYVGQGGRLGVQTGGTSRGAEG